MQDEAKTKSELIEELRLLRQQLATLQTSEVAPQSQPACSNTANPNQTEVRLKVQNEKLTIFNKIIAAVNQSPELEHILTTTLAEIELVFGLGHSEIWLYDEVFQQLKSAAQRGLPPDFAQAIMTFKIGMGLPGVVAQLEAPLMIADLAQEERFQQREIITSYNFRSALGIPLMAQENLVGVMFFFSSQAEHFSPEIAAHLTTIGQLIGTAIQNARLFESVQQHLAEQSALLAATKAISSSLDLTIVLGSLAEKMARTLNVTRVQICDWQPDRGALTILAEYFAPDVASEIERESELGATYYPLDEFEHLGEWLQSGQIMVVQADDSDLTQPEREYLRRHGGQTLLFVPFVLKGIVVGCVQLWESRSRPAFTLDELALCQGIAQQGAIALENARLFGQAQQEIMERKRAEARLARQAEEAALLNRVRTALARELEIPGLAQSVVEAMTNIFAYAMAALYLIKDQVLTLQHQVGYRRLIERLSLWQGIRAEVVRRGKPVLLTDAYVDLTLLETVEPITSVICLPLYNQGTVVGTLEVGSSAGWTLGESELRLMTMVSEYVSIAFERAYLYTEARESEEKYRTLIEQSQDAIYLIYGNRFEIVNHKFQELFGVTQEEINNPDFVFTNIISPKSRRWVAEQTNIEEGPDATPVVSPVYEFTALDKDGREIEVELSVSYPTYKGSIATQGILRDITERKRAEAERAAIQAQMFQNAKLASMGELAAGVAHEINNPIFAIREYADLILEDTPQSVPTYRMLETIIREADRIADIVRNLLEFSRPGETNFNPVHLREIWQLVYTLIRQSFQKQNIRLEVDIPDDLPLVKARRQQIQQVMLNLMTNARDALKEKYAETQHHPNKRIMVKARTTKAVDISAPRAKNGDKIDQFVQFSVRDEGKGISVKDRENLFTPFFTTKRHQGGTGLGLSISYKIIENHGGRIEVYSEPGEFTEFIVTLPTAS
jgi:PAS domain S-box-containing protein